MWIVGSDNDLANPGDANHWDGRAFTRWSVGSGWLTSVWVFGPNDVWAVGGGSVVHSTARRGPRPGSRGRARAKARSRPEWGSGPRDVWVVGPRGAVGHWNGATWTELASGTSADLRGVWGNGPNDVWAVGKGVALHWDGTALSNAGPDVPFAAVAGSGPDDVWAVGAGGAILHHAGTARVVDGAAPVAD